MGKFFKEAIEGISNIDRTSISDAINDAYKTIDTLAMYARQKSDSVIENLMKVSPSEMCDFNTRNGVFMLRLMRLNEQEKEITLNALGVDSMFNGDSTAITETAISPSYAKEMNYKDLFAKKVSSYEKNGQETTRQEVKDGKNVYNEIENLYPDDNSTGTFQNKWITTNQNSLLNKTKKLFNQHKINTIISRFHTDPTTPEKAYDIKTKYGLSHGRNLLTKDAESKGGTYAVNGYDNPYCRVWTHHHQYDKLMKMMRPFYTEEGDVVMLKDLHNWGNNFKNDIENVAMSLSEDGNSQNIKQIDKTKELSWKNNNDRWDYSVLNSPNGLLNITPKYLGGGNKNIHTKQCMFSIENLAWRDYDPYSFEQALSWEQRGPMGGRIMWFPPYGINFNETTTAQWQNSTFIGRGEDVYTYVNTVRSGTLNFMMVVDHPSILDYVSWYEGATDEVKDTDVYRFFAGCDPADSSNPNSLLHYTKPTPLTDEYVEEVTEETLKAELKPTPEEEEISPTEPIEIIFYVFYPNNYSGVYDWVEGENSVTGSDNTGVEAIPYLLYGRGAQMEIQGGSQITKSIPLDFKNENLIPENATGYEMGQAMGENAENYIVGCEQRWFNLTKTQPYKVVTNKNKEYNKRWYYRIDGEYQVEYKGSKNYYRNCYDQQIAHISRADRRNSDLNIKASAVKDAMSDNSPYLFSLAEIASALCSNDKICSRIGANQENVDKLKNEFFNNESYTLNSIVIQGYSNEHGKISPLEKERNKALADGRAKTIKNWLENCKPDWREKISIGAILPSHPIDGGDKTDHSDVEAKKWRSAKVVITLNPVQQEKHSETNQKPEYYEFNDDIWMEWMTAIVDKIQRITYSSEDKISLNKENDIKAAINSVLDNVQFYKDILNNHKEEIYKLIPINNVQFVKGVLEISDNLIENIFKNLKNYLSEDVAATFENLQDFEGKLGGEIKQQINNLKKFKDVISKSSKSIIDIASINKQINDLNEKLNALEKEIEDYNELINKENINISGYQSQVDEFTAKLNQSGITEEEKKQYQHEIDKYNKLIKESKKNNERYNKYIEDKSKEKTKINKEIEKLEKQRDEKISNAEEKIIIPSLEENDIKGVVKKYIQNHGDIDEFYLNSIVDEFIKEVCNLTDIELILDKSEQVVLDINFDTNIWEVYNKIIEKHIKDSKKSTRVKQTELRKAILELNYKITNASVKDVKISELNENSFQKLVEDLESRPIYSDIAEGNKTNFITLVKNCLADSIYVCVNFDINSCGDPTQIIEEIKEELEVKVQNLENSQFRGFSEHRAEDGSVYYINENETNPEKMGLHWIYDEENQQFVLKTKTGEYERVIRDSKGNVIGGGKNTVRYDQEYYFFKVLKEKNRIGYDTLMEKIQYFDPAFHSMTPEGFNARLTFLNQCMRQGNTTTVSDNTVSSANNLAFGRPPYCVLRLGDFYNQMIVIDNISINYDGSNGLQWDLNQEGIGVQPLLANVSISFKFIGGGDLGGPVKRLQNAMSFNYYANASLYDNRADRVNYKWSDKTNGALEENRSLDTDNSVFYNAKTYKNQTVNKIKK